MVLISHFFLFPYQEEWQNFESGTPRFQIFTAFSRDQEDKIYVQHLLEKEAAMVDDYIRVRVSFQ